MSAHSAPTARPNRPVRTVRNGREAAPRVLRGWMCAADQLLRERLDQAEREIHGYRPDAAELRARVAAALDLPAAAGLLQRLHAVAVDDGKMVVSDQGNRYEPLAVWLRI